MSRNSFAANSVVATTWSNERANRALCQLTIFDCGNHDGRNREASPRNVSWLKTTVGID